MRDKIIKIIGKGSKRDTLVLTLATVLAQSINLISYPILSRLFTPEDFGQFAVVNTFAEVFTALCTLGYTRMVILAHDRQSAANIAILSIRTALKSSIVFWLIFLPLSFWLKGVFHDPNFFWWMLIVPIISLAVSVFLIYNEWCVYNKQYNQLSINKITNAGSNSGTRLLVGFFGFFKIGGLIWSELISRIFTAAEIFGSIFKRKEDFHLFKNGTKEAQKKLAKEFRKNATYMVLSNVFNILKQYLPIIFLSIYFGEEFAGHFSMSNFILGVPMLFVGTAIGDVFRQRARESYVKTGSFRPLLVKIVSYQLLIAIPFLVLGYFFLAQIIVWVLGAKWEVAGDFSLLLLPYIALNFFASILMNTFIVTNRLRIFWFLNFLMFIATCTAFSVGIFVLDKDVYFTLGIYSALLALVSCATIILAYIYSADKNHKVHDLGQNK